MGYYTQYTLSLYNRNHPSQEVAEEVRLMADGLFSDFDGLSWFVDAKWYDYHKDMLSLSSKFPNEVFVLEGNGEDADDIWKNYYQNGKCQSDGIVIVSNEFDPSKLSDKANPQKAEVEYFGTVRWCEEDIKEALKLCDVECTADAISKVRSFCEGHHFIDRIIESGWNALYDYIDSELQEKK